MNKKKNIKVVLFANTDWYLYNFRLSLAKAIVAAGAEVVLISPPGPFASRFASHGLRWIPLDMSRRGADPFREVSSLATLVRVFRRERPDLVHSFTVKGVIYGSLASLLAGVPARVNALTGLGYVFASRRWPARVLRPLVAGVLRPLLRGGSARLIVQNTFDRDDLISRNIALEKSTILIRSSGVDISRFSPQSAQRQPGFTVLMATRLLWSKGVAKYFSAAAILKSSHPSMQFVLAGDTDEGNPASVPATVIAQWRDSGIVRVIGHVEDVATLLGSVDVVVLPTIYGEGVPRILVEAAAAGLPIVASDTPGCREIVRSAVNGILVPPDSAEALAAAIAELASDAELRRRMGLAGRQIAVAEFDERLVIGRTLDVYRDLVDEFPKAGAFELCVGAAIGTSGAEQ